MNKILTIIIPSYNMEAYLPKCLGSLIIDDKQLLQKLDIIVVNDGSKDRTSEIAHEFQVKYPDVFRVVDKKNGHYGSCINAALPIARGCYIKVLDADDYVNTESFESYCKIVFNEAEKGDAGADMLVSSYQNVMNDGKGMDIVDFGLNERAEYYTLVEYPATSPRFTIHAVAYRTSMLIKMGYRQTEGICYTDTEWIIEPMSRVRRFRYFHNAVTCYRLGRDGQSMDAATFARDFQNVANITIGIIQRYDRMLDGCESLSLGYYHLQILDMVKMVYLCWREGYEGYKAMVDISDFEKKIKGRADFYEQAGDFSLGVVHYRFYYVRDWRRWHCRYTFAWLAYRVVMMLLIPYCAVKSKISRRKRVVDAVKS